MGGGAIATMMHAPEARGTMCKKYQEQAGEVIRTGAASRVGSVYVTALTKAQAIDSDDYAMQAYNIFGDPTLWLAFSKGPSPTPTPVPPTPPTPPTPVPPTPVPTPTPTPTPAPGSCHAISAVVTGDWCAANCAAGFCPSDLCECDSSFWFKFLMNPNSSEGDPARSGQQVSLCVFPSWRGIP